MGLRVMLEQLARQHDSALLSPGAKRGWTKLLVHNRFDCVSAARLAALEFSSSRAVRASRAG